MKAQGHSLDQSIRAVTVQCKKCGAYSYSPTPESWAKSHQCIVKQGPPSTLRETP